MTIILNVTDHEDLCHGWSWTIEDEDILAERMARIALGQAKHVGRVIDGLTAKPKKTTAEHMADAISKLSVDANGDPYKRDGWIFQAISWIAAHQNRNGGILRAPHIRKADHGFDGLQIELSADKSTVTSVMIFEDKATINPRDTIRDEVWPGIAALEAGQRVTELTHDVTAMLEAYQSIMPVDVEDAVDEILWKEARSYRVSITVSDTHSANAARAGLFSGYDTHAPGLLTKRRAETIYFPDMREWMKTFSAKVAAKIVEIS
ncbi:hypothetical protein GOZ90_25935 [Agrobacterium vitis]|uniref:DUF1837 domain-containing protein n=1 Tax=Agrobacterium vitis TaxID=373 RepID=A0A6L6VP24_AGRVI|nr:hypothetical protein [Agrobacterium vitis]MUZ76089.1 hypothetical protein [Agrobacterium vitis]